MFNVRYDASSEYLSIVDEEQWSGGDANLGWHNERKS